MSDDIDVDDVNASSCMGCFLVLAVSPVAVVALYLIWKWAFQVMGII